MLIKTFILSFAVVFLIVALSGFAAVLTSSPQRRESHINAFKISLFSLVLVSVTGGIAFLLKDFLEPAATQAEMFITDLWVNVTTAGYGSSDTVWITVLVLFLYFFITGSLRKN